jgi:inositol-phosphate transport system ATP-binding protein
MELELRNLTKIYDKHPVVDGIDLKIGEGEFVVFLGPSGCGKTTTLMMTAGLIEPTRGEIRFDGKNVAAVHPKDRQVGMVFQTYALYPHMTVFDNMTFALKLQGVPAAERRARSWKVAVWLGLGDLMDRMPGELSGGQQQRVSVGRALIKEPKLLLFDEPLSNLDANLRVILRGEIKRLQRETGITALYVTHDQAEAMAMADRIAVIIEGRRIAFAPPKDLHDRPKTRRIAEFIGVPPMNFFETELSGESGGLTARFKGGEVALDASRSPDDGWRRVVLGIRPQHLRESSEGPLCEVRNVENLGRDLLVTVHVAGADATFYADPASNAAIGETLRVGFDMGQAQFFDPESGKSLLWN